MEQALPLQVERTPIMNSTAENHTLLVQGVKAHALFMTDPQGNILTWNQGVEQIFHYTEKEWVGQHIRLIFTPEDRQNGACEKEMDLAAREGQSVDVRWHRRKDGSYFWADGVLERLTGDDGKFKGFSKVLRDATGEKENAQRLTASEEQYRTLFESIDVEFCIIEMLFDDRGQAVDYRFHETNLAFERHTGLHSAYGRTMRELVPDLDDFWSRTYGNVALTGEPIRFENHAPAMSRWFDVYALRIGAPEDRKVGVLFTDITARKETQEALRQSEERLRENEQRERQRLTDIFTQTPALMAALRGPDHIFYLANPPYYRLVGNRDIIGKPAAEAMPEVVEQGFIALLDRVYQTGEPFVGTDVPIMLQVTPDGMLEERFLDFTYQPLFDEAGQVSGILAHGIDLTERKRLEIERERLLTDARARAEREALINRIGDGIRQSLPPEQIESLAVAILGKALAADRCYLFTADAGRDTLIIEREWYSKDVPPITGQYRLSEMGIDIEEVFGSGRTLVVSYLQASDGRLSDQNAETNGKFQISSLINVPFYEDGRFVGALAVAMATGPRDWSVEEVTLTETVAGQLRSTVEAARLQQRERNIAQQLQDALQPLVPPNLPGLSLKGFYKPALEEAGVGGDFFDVFPLQRGQTAIVVGDLSGKGLAAASEVATVRNMVRYALYSGTGSAEAITHLDRILVERDLLTGFATLFVGTFDQRKRTLTYVNCGQEPGLVWRAKSGTVEQLPPTGPVLGGFESSAGYRESTLSLEPGDVLALFTDGMTEVGPNRKDLLEIEGLTALFARCCREAAASPRPSTSENASMIKNGLIAGVEEHAGGPSGRRDDIALLVGVTEQAFQNDR